VRYFNHLLVLSALALPVAMYSQTNSAGANTITTASASVGADAGPGANPNRAALPMPGIPYRLHLSDKLEIQLPFAPEYNETTTVQPDGRISLRGTQAVQVAGKTIAETEALIASAYTGILKNPQVSVLLTDFLKPSFYASGEVGHPGRYEMLSDTDLLQAISEAGGLLNERASKTQVIIFRPINSSMYETKVVDVKQMLTAKERDQEIYPIKPGDIIYVPQNKMSKIQKYIPTASVSVFPAL
jgi:polysaccharide biosynthesis/export protein